jgi:hypothetical protein
MPRFDGTGPMGTGPIGWGRGPCGMRRAFRQPITFTKDQEKQVLEAELKEIEAEKEAILKKLKELK